MNRLQGRSHRGDFDENSPRPPVPGEETVNPFKYCQEAVHAPLGYEPEGRCRGSYRESTRSPPACLLWARNLHSLLADTEGVELFRTYLEQEGKPHADALNFWFACEGLKKQTDAERINQLVKVIHRKFITTAQLGIREDLRQEVTARMRNGCIDQGIFDAAQNDVGQRINLTTYPNFLKSDIYLNYVQQQPQDSCSEARCALEKMEEDICPQSSSMTPAVKTTIILGSGSGSSSSSGGREPSLCGPNAMLPTLHEDSELVVAAEPLPLTRDMLAATQSRRAFDSRPRPEAFAGMYLQNGPQSGLARAYSSYNPVSRQDSELQSLSSDARTDSDAMSCADSSVDGAVISHKQQTSKRHNLPRQVRTINRDFTPNVIPRTQRANTMPSSMKPEEFAHVLTQKLEAVLRERETAESLEARLAAADHPRSLTDVICEKFQIDDPDCDQDILDQHVSRVWADRTPCRSPGRPKSPDMRRKAPLHPYPSGRYPPRYPRKEKDLFSTFSSDSGNVHDFPDCSESSRHFPKSKSVPECVDAGVESRMRGIPRRGSSKKTLTEQTDSGVSVVSDSIATLYSPPANKDSEWVKSWLKDYEKHRTAKIQQPRHLRRERSGSLERNMQQPFVGDPLMPPLPIPHTATQLEEARRRLIEDDTRGKISGRQRFPVGGKASAAVLPEASVSNPSTLKKTRRTEAGKSDNLTTVMFSFCDEQFPYRTKLRGHSITLKQFKEILPKKGNYRFYFKTECDEEGAAVIQEEVSDDSEILPMWDGKLIAQVKAVE